MVKFQKISLLVTLVVVLLTKSQDDFYFEIENEEESETDQLQQYELADLRKSNNDLSLKYFNCKVSLKSCQHNDDTSKNNKENEQNENLLKEIKRLKEKLHLKENENLALKKEILENERNFQEKIKFLNDSTAETVKIKENVEQHKINEKTSFFIEQIDAVNLTNKIVTSIILKNSSMYVLGYVDGLIEVRSLVNHDVLQSFSFFKYNVYSIISLENDKIAFAGINKNVFIWDLKRSALIKKLQTSFEAIISMLYIDEDDLLIVTGKSNTFNLEVWNIEQEKILFELKGNTKITYDMKLLDEKTLLTVSYDKTIRTWDLIKKEEVIRKRITEENQPGIITILNSNEIAVGTRKGVISIWNLNKMQNIKQIKAHDSTILSLKKLKSGILVSTADDLTMKIWNIEKDDEMLLKETKFKGNVNSIVLVNSSKMITLGDEQIARIWNIEV